MRKYVENNHPDENSDMRNSGGRIVDLPANPVWRAIAWGAMAFAAVIFFAFIIVPAAKGLVDAATARPDACIQLTASECEAWAQGRGM